MNLTIGLNQVIDNKNTYHELFLSKNRNPLNHKGTQNGLRNTLPYLDFEQFQQEQVIRIREEEEDTEFCKSMVSKLLKKRYSKSYYKGMKTSFLEYVVLIGYRVERVNARNLSNFDI